MSKQGTAHRTSGNVVANQFLDQLQSRKLFLWPDRCVGQSLTNRQLLRFIPVSEQPVMPDLHKPFRQHMKQETPDKLHVDNPAPTATDTTESTTEAATPDSATD